MKTRTSRLPAGALVAAALLVGFSSRAAVLAQWHFDESAGPTASNSVSSLHGTLSPTGAAFVAGGVAGNALSLNRAQNGWVSMGNALGLTSGDFSIVVWVKTTATENSTAPVAKHESFSENGYFIVINPSADGGAAGKATFVASEYVSQGVISTTTVNDGNWHQLVGVYRAGSSELIYVDGAPAEASGTSEPIVPNSAPFLIGGANVSGIATGLYTGLVDEVQVYDQALTDAEVDYLFAHPAQTLAQAPAFVGPSPYLSFADSPFNTSGFDYFHLEDLEDGALNTPGASANAGWGVTSPGPWTDSVDGDDGIIDGAGVNGRSLVSNFTQTNLTITFNAAALGGNLPTHAGIVCTDIGQVTSGNFGYGNVTFSARDGGGTLLGSVTMTNFGNGSAYGSGPLATAEDRFFGVINPGGISTLSLTVANSGDWEVDHLQYGYWPVGGVRPRLRIQLLAPGTAVLAWFTNAVGFLPQEATNLAATNWVAVTNASVIVTDEYQITLSPLPGARFYRLFKP